MKIDQRDILHPRQRPSIRDDIFSSLIMRYIISTLFQHFFVKTRRFLYFLSKVQRTSNRSIPLITGRVTAADQPLIDPNSWHARDEEEGEKEGENRANGNDEEWREAERKEGGERGLGIEEACKTDATSLVHFVLTLSTRMSVYVAAARSYISLPYTRAPTVHVHLHCGPSSNGASARACARAYTTLPGIIDPRLSHGHSCSNVIAPIRACERVSLSLSLSLYFLWTITDGWMSFWNNFSFF